MSEFRIQGRRNLYRNVFRIPSTLPQPSYRVLNFLVILYDLRWVFLLRGFSCSGRRKNFLLSFDYGHVTANTKLSWTISAETRGHFVGKSTRIFHQRHFVSENRNAFRIFIVRDDYRSRGRKYVVKATTYTPGVWKFSTKIFPRYVLKILENFLTIFSSLFQIFFDLF